LLNGKEIDFVANATNGTTSTDISPVPLTDRRLEYLPVSLRYDAGLNGPLGNANFGLGLSANAWYSGTLTNLHNISGSTKSSGNWVTLSPSFSWNFSIYTNWMTSIRGDGQWSSEPLIANEQYGIGGVNSVRGYREGEAFGDTGWHVTFEQQTPPHVVGMVYGHTPLIVRGTLYMDYATVYLLDPQGRPNNVPLWGTGVGLVASIGSHWESRFLISLPLLRTTTTEADEPFFNFSLTAQF
jgi:hemolysin activation/secretion protein